MTSFGIILVEVLDKPLDQLLSESALSPLAKNYHVAYEEYNNLEQIAEEGVLLYAYKTQHSVYNGDFSFSIWWADPVIWPNIKLLLGNNRFGVAPLFECFVATNSSLTTMAYSTKSKLNVQSMVKYIICRDISTASLILESHEVLGACATSKVDCQRLFS